MVRASDAEVVWDVQKKTWVVRVRIGEEVVRRPCKGADREANDETLRSLAVKTAQDDGYDLPSEVVTIKR